LCQYPGAQCRNAQFNALGDSESRELSASSSLVFEWPSGIEEEELVSDCDWPAEAALGSDSERIVAVGRADNLGEGPAGRMTHKQVRFQWIYPLVVAHWMRFLTIRSKHLKMRRN
jgi:hypothetical protein